MDEEHIVRMMIAMMMMIYSSRHSSEESLLEVVSLLLVVAKYLYCTQIISHANPAPAETSLQAKTTANAAERKVLPYCICFACCLCGYIRHIFE